MRVQLVCGGAPRWALDGQLGHWPHWRNSDNGNNCNPGVIVTSVRCITKSVGNVLGRCSSRSGCCARMPRIESQRFVQRPH